MDDIHSNEKKSESNSKNKFLNQKRRSPSNISSISSVNENSLVMPLFADDDITEKDGKESKVINKNNNSFDEKEEIISTSLKEINIILKHGEKFISIIKGKKFLDTIKSKENIRKTGKILLEYKGDSSIKNYLNIALEDYMKFSKLLEFFMYKKENSTDSKEKKENDKKSKKKTPILDTKKSKCNLLIRRIMTKLSQFLLEYNFIVEVIKEITDKNKDCVVFKNVIEFIDKNISIISKENIENLEKILKTELENATNFYSYNYADCDK